MTSYICGMCGWEYAPEEGCLASGVRPGTAFEDLPDDFCCPVCGACKANFLPKEGRRRPGPPDATGGQDFKA